MVQFEPSNKIFHKCRIPSGLHTDKIRKKAAWTLKSDSLSSQNGRTFHDFNKFMRELPFLFMLEHGVEHGPEHGQLNQLGPLGFITNIY